MIFSGVGEAHCGLLIAEALPLFRISFNESIRSRAYALLQNMEVTRPIYTVEETPRGIFLKRSTDGEEAYSLRRGTGISD